MTYTNLRFAFASAHHYATYLFIIIVILTIIIASVLWINDWLISTILSGKELKILESYDSYSN